MEGCERQQLLTDIGRHNPRIESREANRGLTRPGCAIPSKVVLAATCAQELVKLGWIADARLGILLSNSREVVLSVLAGYLRVIHGAANRLSPVLTSPMICSSPHRSIR